MANAVYDAFKAGILGGLYDLDTATIKVALVRNYVFNAAHTFMSDVTAAAIVNGTSPALTGTTVAGGVFDANDTTIPTTGHANTHYLILYQASAPTGGSDLAATAQRLIAYFDTGTGMPIAGVGNGTLTVAWSNGSTRILKVG